MLNGIQYLLSSRVWLYCIEEEMGRINRYIILLIAIFRTAAASCSNTAGESFSPILTLNTAREKTTTLFIPFVLANLQHIRAALDRVALFSALVKEQKRHLRSPQSSLTSFESEQIVPENSWLKTSYDITTGNLRLGSFFNGVPTSFVTLRAQNNSDGTIYQLPRTTGTVGQFLAIASTQPAGTTTLVWANSGGGTGGTSYFSTVRNNISVDLFPKKVVFAAGDFIVPTKGTYLITTEIDVAIKSIPNNGKKVVTVVKNGTTTVLTSKIVLPSCSRSNDIYDTRLIQTTGLVQLDVGDVISVNYNSGVASTNPYYQDVILGDSTDAESSTKLTIVAISTS